jgi:hypothetical protein
LLLAPELEDRALKGNSLGLLYLASLSLFSSELPLMICPFVVPVIKSITLRLDRG